MINDLLKQLGDLDTGPKIVIDDLAHVEELLEQVRFEFNSKEVTVPEPDDLPSDPDLVDMDALRKKYSMGQLKKLAKDGGLSGYSKLKEDELITFLLDNGIAL